MGDEWPTGPTLYKYKYMYRIVKLEILPLLPQIGQHNHFMLRDFFSSTMASSRAALVGVGIDTMHLTRMASVLQLSSEKGAADAKVLTFWSRFIHEQYRYFDYTQYDLL